MKDDFSVVSRIDPVAVIDQAESCIFIIRGKKIMLDADLAVMYGVETRRLNEQVKRNRERFPDDFMFQLTAEETENLISQFATSSSAWGGRRKRPYAFTEHGALMAASVLNSPRAVKVSLLVVRAFVRLRQILASNRELAQKLSELETRLSSHDRQILGIVHSIRQLTQPLPVKKGRRIGFRRESEDA